MTKNVENSVDDACGIIMPISATDGYPTNHWNEVMAIISNVAQSAGFRPNIVSDADDVGIIHNRIVNNLAENPIVICDVSSKNPNVMFELGLRLAFDKATIIIKDDKTNYNFDTSPIEHLSYPADLRYNQIEEFKIKLEKKLKATFEASKKEGYSTFLKNFIKYKPQLKSEEIPLLEYIKTQFDELKRGMQITHTVTPRVTRSINEESSNIRTTAIISHPDAYSLLYVNLKAQLEKIGFRPDFILEGRASHSDRLIFEFNCILNKTEANVFKDFINEGGGTVLRILNVSDSD